MESSDGHKTVLSAEEEQLIVRKLLFAASRGAAVGYEGIRYMMSRVAADGRQGYNNGVPSDAALQSFRARQRELTFRAQESKKVAKSSAETEAHVAHFFILLSEIGDRNPGLLKNPHRIWNLDETRVDYIFGKKKKVFTSATSHHGGFKRCSTTYSAQKHITALVAVSASGHKSPPFFIIEGKRINERWFDPISGNFANGFASGICARYSVPNWFPDSSAVVQVSENGSMEMEILEAAIKHISKFMRTIVGSEKVLLTLNGHAFRNGVGWIEECLRQNIEAVLTPANTSHFLQPCDQSVNKGYKENGRALGNGNCTQGRFDTHEVNFNLACGVYSFECIILSDAIRSFEECGLFTFQCDFATLFRSAVDNVKDRAASQADSIRSAGIASRLPSVVQRKSNNSTYEELKSIFQSSSGRSSALQRIAVVLKNADTVNAILMSVDSSEKENNSPTQVSGNLPNVLHDADASAECVTLREVFEKCKEALVAKELKAAVKKSGENKTKK